MLAYKVGDVLQSKNNIICHQVNEDGVMGGGIAKQIARLYPKVERQYKKFCEAFKDRSDLIGQYVVVNIGEHKYIANCFTQRNYVTNLKAIEQVFRGLLETCERNNFTIAIPKNYGCGIANGNWEEVSHLIEQLSNEYGIDIDVYELKGNV